MLRMPLPPSRGAIGEVGGGDGTTEPAAGAVDYDDAALVAPNCPSSLARRSRMSETLPVTSVRPVWNPLMMRYAC